MAATIKTIKTIVFDGKKSSWDSWQEKFLSLARTKGYREVMTGVTPIPRATMTTDDPPVPIPFTPEEEAVIELNATAYGDLACSIDTTTQAGLIAFAMITITKTPNYPDGNASEAWTRLTNRFSPDTDAELQRKVRKYQEARLRPGLDPTTFLLHMTKLQIDISKLDKEAAASDRLFMSQVIHNLSPEYETTVETLLELLHDDSLTIEQMEELIIARYDRMQKKDKEPRDIALLASTKGDKLQEYGLAGLSQQFKGRCNTCGKYGHKASDCRSGGNRMVAPAGRGAPYGFARGATPGRGGPYPGPTSPTGQVKFNGFCFYCKKQGHKKVDCRKYMADNPAMERAQLAMGTSGYREIALTCLGCVENQDKQGSEPSLGGYATFEDGGPDTKVADPKVDNQETWMREKNTVNQNEYNYYDMVMNHTSYELALMASSLDDDNLESETDGNEDLESEDLFERSSSDGVATRLPELRRSIIYETVNGIMRPTHVKYSPRTRSSDGDQDYASLAYASETNIH